MRKVIVDVETESLSPKVVHCIVVKDIETNEVFKFVKEECHTKFPSFAKEVELWIGHNILEFDIPKVLDALLGIKIDASQTVDTYVLSRLSFSDRLMRDQRDYGILLEKLPSDQALVLRRKPHSLFAWGIRCGRYKPEIEDWSIFTPEMLHRCKEDVEINHLTYLRLQDELKGFSSYSVRLEHRVASIIAEQVRNGVYLDECAAMGMYNECKAKASKLREEITKEIPPRIVRLEKGWIVPKTKEVKVFTGQYKLSETTGRKVKVYDVIKEISSSGKYYKHASNNGQCKVVGPFSPIDIEPFNPDSSEQRLEVLNKAGWNPVNFNAPTAAMKNKGITQGSPLSTDEENLDTIPDTAPQSIKKLGLYLMYTNRYKLVEQWRALRDTDGRIRGYVDSCGTPTGRMRHNSPNLANIVSVESKDGVPLRGEEGKYGFECRNCFSVEDKSLYELVGCDAASLEIRMLAHYMNDTAFTNQVVNGDIYVYIQGLLGLSTRRVTKSVLLAFIYGAGNAKLGRLIGGSERQGSLLKAKMLKSIPALKTLIDDVTKQAAERGYLIGLDGRKLWVRKQHAALNLLLQSAGAIVMKQALVTAYKEIQFNNLQAKFILNVHDEWQLVSFKEHSDLIGPLLVNSIVKAGEFFKMKIPMGGNWKKGESWAMTH